MTLYSLFVIFFLNILLCSVKTDGNTCGENRVTAMAKIYREIQCTPIFDAKKQCPRAYDCQIFRTISANPNKCYWNNTEYEVGSQLPNELTEMDCFASCYCSSSKDLRRTELNIVQAGFRCANIECPSDLDYNNSPPEAGCHYEHNLRNCCPSGIICPHKDRIIRQSCMVDGQIILHGMRIEPSNSECSSCVCNDGKVECREVNCGVQLLHLNDLADGVGVLFYGEGKCCPIGYVWPTGNEVIRPRALISGSNNDQTFQCKFGNLTVGIGDEVITSETNENTKCACLVPPLITCIQQPHSD